MDGEVTVEPTEELIPHGDMVSFFTKGKNRSHFAALLVEHLIDEDTRAKSNVCGWKKEQLDSTIIESVCIPFETQFLNASCFRWVKVKSFEYHPSEGNFKGEWQKCVEAINSKNRSIKRKQSYRAEL